MRFGVLCCPLIVLATVGAGTSGFASASPPYDPAEAVREVLAGRLPGELGLGPAEDGQPAPVDRSAAGEDLSVERAVAIALRGNRSLRATLRDLGVAQSEVDRVIGRGVAGVQGDHHVDRLRNERAQVALDEAKAGAAAALGNIVASSAKQSAPASEIRPPAIQAAKNQVDEPALAAISAGERKIPAPTTMATATMTT